MRPGSILPLAACLGMMACSEAERAPAAAAPEAASVADAAAAPAAGEEHGGVPEPDIVYGRQVLMSELLQLMLPIDRAAAGESFDLADARRRAEAISAILVAFPWMFPEGTDVAGTRDNDWPTIATDLVWEDIELFHETAEEAAAYAFEMVTVTDEAQFRDMARTLRQKCDSCHASYMYDWRGEAYGLDPVTGEPLPRPD